MLAVYDVPNRQRIKETATVAVDVPPVHVGLHVQPSLILVHARHSLA